MAKTQQATIEDLQFDDRNFNKHTEFGLSLLEKSLRNNGAGRSILIDKNNRIIGGNGVVEVAGQIGLDKVRIVESDGTEIIAVKRTDIDLDSKQGREMALADNATAAADLEWDAETIAEVESEFDISASDWGVDIDFTTDETQASEDDFDEETDTITPKCKKGEIWKLGEHRLMCGDSTSKEDFAKLMGEELADMVFTDPPYNVEIVGGVSRFAKDKSGGQTIMNDKWESDEQAGRELWLPAFTCMREYCKDQCAIYVTMPQGGTHMMMMMMMMAQAGWQVKHEIIWRKNSLVLGRQDYNYQHEPICYGWNKTHKFVGKGKWAKTSVWEIDRPTKSKEHPTMKPVELVVECMLDNSDEGDIVLDAFGGSGTTIVACEQLNRKCFMMELDPHYCDVIIARWEKLTGKVARRLNDG